MMIKGQQAPDDGRMGLYLSGYNDAAIGKLIGKHFTTIQHWRVRYGLPAKDMQGGNRR